MISNTKTTLPVNRETVSLSDRDIIKRYLGLDKIPCVISSPLREDDDRPSFSIYEKDGKIRWKDFGTGEGGNTITLMSKLWNVTYSEALVKMKFDTDGTVPHIGLTRHYSGKIHITSNSEIRVKTREWRDWDIEYWGKYGISRHMCEWCNVYPISHAFFKREDAKTHKEQTICVPMDKYAYAYFEWKDDKQSIKLYQPFSEKMKWLSKHDSSVWDLWRHAFAWAERKSNECCIITSSRKDAMCLWETLGVPCMSLQGEGYIPKPQVMNQVLKTFKTVYIWYDNDYKHKQDNPGQENAKRLIEMYPNLKNICIPAKYKSKDPSDLVMNWGKNMLIEIWKEKK